MKDFRTLTFAELNMELINKGLVYDSPDIPNEYDQSAILEGIYEWGFTIVTYCNVLDPIIAFYDWKLQSIIHLDMDEYTDYSLRNGYLHVNQRNVFSDESRKYMVNLKDGAPVHVEDIVAIGYAPNLSLSEDRRFYALKDGRIYFKEDGADLRLLKDVTLTDLIHLGYVLLDKDVFQSNVNVLNDMIVTK